MRDSQALIAVLLLPSMQFNVPNNATTYKYKHSRILNALLRLLCVIADFGRIVSKYSPRARRGLKAFLPFLSFSIYFYPLGDFREYLRFCVEFFEHLRFCGSCRESSSSGNVRQHGRYDLAVYGLGFFL